MFRCASVWITLLNVLQPSHRRGRSLSDVLTLERSEEGALVISSPLANQGLREGTTLHLLLKLFFCIDFDCLKSKWLKYLSFKSFPTSAHRIQRNHYWFVLNPRFYQPFRPFVTWGPYLIFKISEDHLPKYMTKQNITWDRKSVV